MSSASSYNSKQDSKKLDDFKGYDLKSYGMRLAYLKPPLDKYSKDDGLHYGQKKLFLVEVAFLTRFAHLADEIVYVGAAPGTHLTLLQEFFADHKFVCYDPLPFVVTENEKLTIKKQFFTEIDAKEWAAKGKTGKKFLFISDIRFDGNNEQSIVSDMNLQKSWVKIMQPEASSLKFRLPWWKGKTPYMSGTAYLQPYAPPRSTETRLFSTKADIDLKAQEETWDNTDYEALMFHFNCVARNERNADKRIERMIIEEYSAVDGKHADSTNKRATDMINKFFHLNGADLRNRAKANRSAKQSGLKK